MKKNQQLHAIVDPEGRLVLPSELTEMLGLTPGAEVTLEPEENSVRLLRPVSHLARIYVEVTDRCNLDCTTCMRNVWMEPQGFMSSETFDRVLEGAFQILPKPLIFFGGYGEPLLHPEIAEMVHRCRLAGCRVELITNGILLNEDMALNLMKAGLDRLWVSIDGASPECFADVRLGASLPQVVENLKRLRPLRVHFPHHAPSMQLGISFVAMRRNIQELPEVIKLGVSLGAMHIMVTNVLAHTPQLNDQTLYRRSLQEGGYLNSPHKPRVDLPRMDNTPDTAETLNALSDGRCTIHVAHTDPARAVDVCPFIERGSLSVRWDGMVSPCLPLLHTHDSYLYDRMRITHAYMVGNLKEKSLLDIWQDPEYTLLRRRLQQFDFSPCSYCNCCDLAGENLQDCLNSPQPVCGGCLWAQGIIQCP